MAVTLEKIENPQELEVWVNGPDGANRLFIYTGIAVFQLKGRGEDWHWDHLHVEVGRSFTPNQIKQMIGGAYLNSIRNDGHAVNAGWAVDNVELERKSNGKIDVDVSLAVKDENGYMLRVGYEVQVMAKL